MKFAALRQAKARGLCVNRCHDVGVQIKHRYPIRLSRLSLLSGHVRLKRIVSSQFQTTSQTTLDRIQALFCTAG